MGMEKKELYSWAKSLSEPRIKDILDLIYNHHLNLEKKSRWGDKTPPYIRILPELATLYPEAKFIHLVRDGHDVAKSFRNQGWNGKWLFRNTVEWKEAITLYNSYKRTKLADRIFEVKYENMVLDTEATVKKICSFLEECFEPGMLNWENQGHDKIPQRELHIHDKIFRRPQKSDVLKWRRELSLLEILLTESFIHDELKSVGYNVKFKGVLWKSVFFLVRSYCYIVFSFYSVMRRLLSSVKKIILKTRSCSLTS
jgi:hypothetical protein